MNTYKNEQSDRE